MLSPSLLHLSPHRSKNPWHKVFLLSQLSGDAPVPPVPELPLDALHVEGDPVKIQALVQPSSDLRGIHNEKTHLQCDLIYLSTRLMSHKARGSSRLKRYLRWRLVTNYFCEGSKDKTYISSSPWQTPGSVMFAFLALSEKRAWKALLSGEAYSSEYLQRSCWLCIFENLPPKKFGKNCHQ